MPTSNNSDSVGLSINSRLHNFTKSGAPWIVTLSSSDFYKDLWFSFILNCTVPSLMLFYNLMKSRVVSKGKICELLGHYRRGPKSTEFLPTHYSLPRYLLLKRIPGLENVRVSRVYRAYDAIGFVTLSLIQCIYVLKCRVIICLDNRFMNVRPQVPPPFTRTKQSFLSYPLNFSKTLIKLRKRFFKKLTYKWAVRNVSLFSVAICEIL